MEAAKIDDSYPEVKQRLKSKDAAQSESKNIETESGEQTAENNKCSAKINETQSKYSVNKIYMFIFWSLVLDLLAFTLILPLFPSILDYYDRTEDKTDSFYSFLLRKVKEFQKFSGAPDEFTTVLFGGALGSLYSFLQFLSGPIVGRISDIYGRKITLIVCLIGIVISHAIWFSASSFSLFVLARIVGGLSKANVNIMMTIVTDVSDEKTRSKGMAIVGLAFSIGFIIGPMAGAWFAKQAATSTRGWGQWGQLPAIYALVLSIFNVLLVAKWLPETLPKNKRAPGLAIALPKAIDYISPVHLIGVSAVKELTSAQRSYAKKVFIIYLLFIFLYSGMEFTLTFLTHHTFGYTSLQQGKMFLIIGLIMSALQGGAVRRMNRIGPLMTSKASLIVMPLSFLLIANAGRGDHSFFVGPLTSLWSGLVVYSIATAFAFSNLTSVAASCEPKEGLGTLLGCFRSLGALGRAAGPLLTSSIYWYWGAPITYTLGCIGLLVPAYLIMKLKDFEADKNK